MMNPVLIHVLLAFVWMFIQEQFTMNAFVIGLVVGFFAIIMVQRLYGEGFSYAQRTIGFIYFVLCFLKELLIANLQIAYEVMTPGFKMTPGIVACPVDDLPPVGKVILANSITLTPGTLSVHIDDGGKYIYVHGMYVPEDREAFIKDIEKGLKNPLKKLLLIEEDA